MGKYIKGISVGSGITVIIIILAIIFGENSFIDRLFLYDVMPYFTIEANYMPIYEESLPASVEVFELGDAYIEEGKAKVEEKYDISAFKDINVLRQSLYSVDKKTSITKDLFDVDKFQNTNVHIEPSKNEPKILIFHTHAHELYADSKDKSEGVVGAGEHLAQVMESKYGVKCLHITQSFDEVEGSVKITGAYERMEPEIKKIIAQNPSIELVIDLHRDGVREGVRLVSDIEGKPTAKIMFFNGLCKIIENGELTDIDGLDNKYLDTNLALSFKMQMKANELYPKLTRKIYLNAYRYSLHLKDKSMLIEVGAQTNTKEEARNAIDRLAEVLYETVFK